MNQLLPNEIKIVSYLTNTSASLVFEVTGANE